MSRCKHCPGQVLTDSRGSKACLQCGREPDVVLVAPPTRPTWCGTLSGYTNHECRCPRCKDAHSTYWKTWNAKRKREKEEPMVLGEVG